MILKQRSVEVSRHLPRSLFPPRHLFKFVPVDFKLQDKFCGGYKERSKSWVDDKEKKNFKEVQGGDGFSKWCVPKVRGIYFVCSWKQRKVRDIISNVVDLVMEAKGSKKGLADLFSSQMYQQISASLRVPDCCCCCCCCC